MSAVHADTKNETIPSVEQLVDRTHALIPLLRERAAEDEANRTVNPDTVRRMNEAGLFRVLQPRRWGGYELGQRAFAEVQIALGEGDMSVAWIYGVIGLHSLHIGLMDDRAAQDVWGNDSSVLVASPYMPGGTATPVEGGFEFSGRWSYSSGSEHCDWTFLGGFVNGDPTDYRAFLLPRADAKIVDTWRTTGLAATGSHDIVVEKAFIPEYRTHKFIDGFNGTSPGRQWNDNPLYRMPFMLVFMRGITNGQIGALQHFLDLFKAYAKDKVFMGSKTAKDPDAQLAVASAEAGIDEMKKVMFANFEIMQDYAERDEMPPLDMRHMMRFQSASVADRCVKLAEGMLTVAGGGGVYDTSNMGRIYRNMLTGRQHAAAQYRIYGRTYGDKLMGGEPFDMML
ncbi:flavin-dependent monooxygenase [Sphingobium sp. LMA1-1-1.1]|uniref:acyl-CoA dehydrogenase family protein n=1 Tax=unclassified Sphingobium TaxID=2611147 RepID=UPI00343EA407